MAAAYLDGSAGQKQFSMDRIRDPKVRALSERVDYAESPEFTSRYPEKWGCSLEVDLDDGTRFEKVVLDASGSVANPMTPAQIDAKFRGLVGPVLGDIRAEALLRDLRKLDALKSVPTI